MKKLGAISLLYYVAMIYDGVLGLAFLFAAPNHFGYVQFPGALLIVFALMYLAIARDPVRNRNLVPYGALLKVAYCAVVFYHWIASGIPGMWKPFAIIDLVFLVLFIWSYSVIGAENKAGVSAKPA